MRSTRWPGATGSGRYRWVAVPDTPLAHPTPPSSFQAGRLIVGRYRLEQRIASGGMAEVWQAADEVLGRQVAVKILHPHLAADDTFVARFRSEAIAAARLHHPGIVAIYDTGHEHDAEAIVMELVRGRTLRQEIDQRGFLEPAEVVRIGAEVADALAAAHRAGVVHRDIKPANILMCPDDRVMVTDFGIAKIRDDPDLTQTGTMLGTVKYLAPEQVRGEQVDGRSDVYALGIVLFEALCARPPFVGDSPAATALARLNQPCPRPRTLRPTIPAGLDAVIIRCLQLAPADRYRSAEDLRAALLEPGTLRDDDLTTSVDHTGAWALATRQGRQTGASGSLAGPPAGTTTNPNEASTPLVREPATPGTASHGVWLRPVLAGAFVVAAITLAGVLLDRSGAVSGWFGWTRQAVEQAARQDPGTSSPATVVITGISSFDPEGRGAPGENDGQLPLAIDGDPATGWVTESYDQRKFGIKSGVGVIVTVDQVQALHDLTAQSPTQDWAASVYVADSPGATLADWGEPVDQQTRIAGSTTFDLHGRRGRAVLVWITDLGSGPVRVRAQIDELRLRG
jgi:tRNA A-37 threonylcarbamoyl transferase component Bud32